MPFNNQYSPFGSQFGGQSPFDENPWGRFARRSTLEQLLSMMPSWMPQRHMPFAGAAPPGTAPSPTVPTPAVSPVKPLPEPTEPVYSMPVQPEPMPIPSYKGLGGGMYNPLAMLLRNRKPHDIGGGW